MFVFSFFKYIEIEIVPKVNIVVSMRRPNTRGK